MYTQTYLRPRHWWRHWSCCNDWGSRWRRPHHWRAAHFHCAPLERNRTGDIIPPNQIKCVRTGQQVCESPLHNTSSTQVLWQKLLLSNQFMSVAHLMLLYFSLSHMEIHCDHVVWVRGRLFALQTQHCFRRLAWVGRTRVGHTVN